MGGLYNAINGHSPACLLLAPMLTEENPQSFFPRFRDCFLDGERIVIFTRVGGGNRSEGYGEEKLYAMPTFARTYDDDFDSTYGYYEFGVPDEWREDFERVREGRIGDLSERYVERIQGCFPDLDVRGILGREGS